MFFSGQGNLFCLYMMCPLHDVKMQAISKKLKETWIKRLGREHAYLGNSCAQKPEEEGRQIRTALGGVFVVALFVEVQ